MAFNGTSEALPFACADYFNSVTDLELGHIQAIPNLIAGFALGGFNVGHYLIQPYLPQMLRGNAVVRGVAGLRLRGPLIGSEADLDRLVAIALTGLYLGDHARTGFNDRD